jgi:hypothetical protein
LSFSHDDTSQVNPFTFAIDGTGVAVPPPTYQATITFDATDAQGNVLSSVPVGTSFQLREIAQDTSGNGATGGIFSAYVNSSYDPSLVSIASDALQPVVNFSGWFPNGQNENTQTPGTLSNTGAIFDAEGNNYKPPGSAPQLIFSVPVTALAVGSATFAPSYSSDPGGVYPILVFGDNSELLGNQVTFVPATINITGQPTIGVSGGGQPIADGASGASSANDTDFGTAVVGSAPVTETFAIANTGTAPLNLGTVSLGGANAGDFQVLTQPASSVAPQGSTTFSVQFQPSAAGARTASISFSEDDPTQPDPFTFVIAGTGEASVSIDDAQATAPGDPAQTANANFVVHLSAAAPQTVTVNFATVDGTATAGTDYQATSGTLTFAPGTTSATLSVVASGTLYANPSRQFTVVLSAPVGAVITASTATGTIANNNAPTWTNPLAPNDVNGDGHVSPIDALVVINDLDTVGPSLVSAAPQGAHAFFDVNDDGAVSAIDALVVINDLNNVVHPGLASAATAAASNSASAAAPAPAATAAINSLAAPTPQLVDVAMALYSAQESAVANSAAGLPGKSLAGRRTSA